MEKTKKSTTLLAGITLLVFVFIFFKLNDKNIKEGNVIKKTPIPSSYVQNQMKETLITKASTKKGWVTYSSTKYGFDVDVPAGSLLVQESDYYIRIQNYSLQSNHKGLNSGEYYLEMSINNQGSVDEYSCKSDLVNPVKTTIKNVSGFEGSMKSGGESAQVIYALCAQKGSTNFNIYASEDKLYISREIIKGINFN